METTTKGFGFSRVSLAITQKASQRHLKKKALERLCIAESYEQKLHWEKDLWCVSLKKGRGIFHC